MPFIKSAAFAGLLVAGAYAAPLDFAPPSGAMPAPAVPSNFNLNDMLSGLENMPDLKPTGTVAPGVTGLPTASAPLAQTTSCTETKTHTAHHSGSSVHHHPHPHESGKPHHHHKPGSGELQWLLPIIKELEAHLHGEESGEHHHHHHPSGVPVPHHSETHSHHSHTATMTSTLVVAPTVAPSVAP